MCNRYIWKHAPFSLSTGSYEFLLFLINIVTHNLFMLAETNSTYKFYDFYL